MRPNFQDQSLVSFTSEEIPPSHHRESNKLRPSAQSLAGVSQGRMKVPRVINTYISPNVCEDGGVICEKPNLEHMRRFIDFFSVEHHIVNLVIGIQLLLSLLKVLDF